MASTRTRAVAALFIVLAFTTPAIESISDSDDQDSQRVAASRRKATQKRGFGTFADDVYDEILAHLIRGTAPVLSRDNPSFVRDKKVYNHLRKAKGSLRVQRIFSPVEENDVETLVITDCNGKLLIAVKESSIERIITWFYDRSKGEGALKLSKRIAEHYAGISSKKVQEWLNNNPEHFQLSVKFRNKAELKSIDSDTVLGRIQIDLVDFSKMQSVLESGETYKYVLSVLDVFSRFLILRPLAAKESVLVAKELANIFSAIGKPSIIQCDRGTEFMGEVTRYCERKKIRMIRSSPYYPQSQGKIERSHGTWKRKLLSDTLRAERCGEDLCWAENLVVYQDLYNSAPHKSLGNVSPHEVFFGRKMTMFRKPSDVGNDPSSDSEDGSMDDNDYDGDDSNVAASVRNNSMLVTDNGDDMDVINCTRNMSRYSQHISSVSDIRKNAHKASQRAALRMKSLHKAAHPPTTYLPGDKVLARFPRKPFSQSRKKSLQNVDMIRGKILREDRNKHRYFIEYEEAGNFRRKWFDVKDITSTTLAQEKTRHNRQPLLLPTAPPSSYSRQFLTNPRSTAIDWRPMTSTLATRHYRPLSTTVTPHARRVQRRQTKGKKSKGEEEKLAERLRALGLRIRDVGGEGNCLFLSISDQYFGSSDKHQLVREIIAQYIASHAAHYSQFIVGMSVEEYVRQVSMDGVWGDHIDIHAFANALNVKVVVVESSEQNEVTIVSPDCPNEDTGLIVIGHIGQFHFVSVRQKDSPHQREAVCRTDGFPQSAVGRKNVTPDIENVGRNNDTQLSDDLSGNHGTEQSEVISLNNCTQKTLASQSETTNLCNNCTMWTTAHWGECASDGKAVRNSCPIDGPITFFSLLFISLTQVAALFTQLAHSDKILSLLICVASLCRRKLWGDAKVHWMKETQQLTNDYESAGSINCWGSEGDRFFNFLLTSKMTASICDFLSTCKNSKCPKRKIIRKRTNVHLK